MKEGHRALKTAFRRGVPRLLAVFLAGFAGLGGATPARARGAPATPATPAAPAVLRVEVEGNQNVPTDQVLQWFSLRPGDPFDPSRVSRALHELTAKHRFSDVRIEGEEQPDGIVLHIVVREYPRLHEVRIEGADKIKEKDIRAAIHLSPGSFLSPAQLRDDREKIAGLYRDKGYFRAAVRDTLVGPSPDLLALVLRIDEGPKVAVRKVVFTGNEHLSAAALQKQMKTKEDGFLHGGDLKPDKLQEDLEKLAGYYRDRGYLDAQIVHHDLDVDPNGKDLTLRIQVQEGPRYSVGNITWSGNTVFDNTRIQPLVRLRPGEPFSESAYEATTTALYELYNDAGYIHFNATPRRSLRGQIVDLAYSFDEGSAARVHQIRIVGNTKTQDKVILREFLVLPGDTFDRSKLMRSIREIYSLGFFEDAGIQNFTPRDDGSVDLELRVAEKQTGQLGAGAGYSASNGVTGFIEVAETNLFGTGKRLSLRWEFGRHNNEVDFGFSQQWLFDTPTSLGVELYNTSRRSLYNAYYREKRLGGSLTLGRRLDFLDYTRVSWRYRAESVRLSDFSIAYQGSLRNQKWPRRTFSTGLTLRRDSTDNPFFPNLGSIAEASADLFGTFLGGDDSYVRSVLSLAWFQRLGNSKLTLALRPRLGVLHGLDGRQPPEYELWRPGGNRYLAVRGYEDYEIVPEGNPASLGGRAMSLFTAEVTYPFSPKVHGLVFFDAGNTWNTFREADFSYLRKGAGVGVRVDVPMLGQVGLDYGYGWNRPDALGRPTRGAWQLHFNFGPMF
jgi:outer membrane protein insertion porin family